jgi:gamma-glutamyltranspeptidase / glutathione hydrolase
MMSGGFLLNNQLTDFSFDPRAGDRDHPNAVAPGKRPRSSMSPVIVLDAEGRVRLALGARGGPRIIPYVARTLVAVLDWGLEIQEAIALPNFVHAEGRVELERNTPLAARRAEFAARGHRVREAALDSGLHGIERTATGWRGGADPRLDGVARGD